MELPNLLNRKKQPTQPTYIAVEIGLESIRTAVWRVVGNNPEILQQGGLEVLGNNQKAEDYLTSLDTSLAQALEGINPEPNQVILSLPESWLQKNDIAPAKKQLLRYLTEKLELEPIGFVITSEAVVHYLEKEKGQSPNLILLGLSSEDVAVSVIQTGSVLATHVVGRSDDLGADIEEGIARFGDLKTLPAHMVLYDGGTDLSQLQQDLIEYDWQSRLPFLHIPKIDILSSTQVLDAVVYTAGEQVVEQSVEVSDATDETPTKKASLQASELPDKQEEFGFTISHPDVTPLESEEEDLETTPEDDNLVPVEEIPQPPLDPDEDDDFQEEYDDSQEIDDQTGTSRFGFLSRFLPTKASDDVGIPKRAGRRLVVLLVLLVLFLVGTSAAAVAGYWYLPHATVTIFVQPRNISKTISFVIDSETKELDISQSVVPGVPIETEITASAQTAATGEKLVGERAQGQVTLYNRTDSTKVFEAGTQLSGPGDLTYTLDEEVNIASASSIENDDLSITTEPSTATVAITADTIGAEYNVDSGTEFRVGNFSSSSYVARASEAISGGTSRQITAVSQEDIALVRQQVNQEIERKLLEQLNQSQQGFTGAVILSDEDEEVDETFSAEAGDEASQVQLEARTQVRSMSYNKSDLAQLLQELTQSELPQDYTLTSKDVELDQVEVVEASDTQVEVSAVARIKAVPPIDPVEVAQIIRGKFPSVTQEYFRSLPGFQRVEIDIKPDLPTSIKTFPRIEGKTQVNIEVIESP